MWPCYEELQSYKLQLLNHVDVQDGGNYFEKKFSWASKSESGITAGRPPNDKSVSEVSKYVGGDCEVWMRPTFSGQSGDQCVIASQREQQEILLIHGSMGVLPQGAGRLGKATGRV